MCNFIYFVYLFIYLFVIVIYLFLFFGEQIMNNIHYLDFLNTLEIYWNELYVFKHN